MKKYTLLFVSGLVALAIAACGKDDGPSKSGTDNASTDENLAGETVTVGDYKKIFVLNEGQMGANNATLDFLRFSDGKYVWNAYNQMNPELPLGLGDVGNDIAVTGGEVWMVINNSGLIEVADARNERHIATIEIPTPRSIVFEGKYAYVTSWNGAVLAYGDGYSVDAANSKNPKGVVYKIDIKSHKVLGNVEVGYQPEGLAVYNGNLYVANSGGISSQLAPAYAYDYTVSIVSLSSFKLTETVEVAPNLKSVFSDGKGTIYVTTLGNYSNVHSGLYAFSAAAPKSVSRVQGTGAIAYNGSVAAVNGTKVYVLGNDTEFDWNAKTHDWYIWSVEEGTVTDEKLDLSGINPYAAFSVGSQLIVSDAKDYVGPGSVTMFDLTRNAKLWTVTAGVCPGHFAIWN